MKKKLDYNSQKPVFKRITPAKSNRQIKAKLLLANLALNAISYSIAYS